jgi:hypothetical protein
MARLGASNRPYWQLVLEAARKAFVWMDLAAIFQHDLDHPGVVLCAVASTTSTLETMTFTNRTIFLEEIRSKAPRA